MNRINVLDCTLRDGGYCNNWLFGDSNIKRIITGLVAADIDIIECGFLTDKSEYKVGTTRFIDFEQMCKFLPLERGRKQFVVMINYGEYDVEKLPEYDGTSVDSIRVAFHKRDMVDALDACRVIKKKGYKVFVQPMVSLGYSDSEFIEMVNMCNEIMPYAFYIVDSFGMMKKKDLNRLFAIVDNNLHEKISIGFHSHNNMQLSYSNAQNLIDMHVQRNIIIDSAIYGMGRGAGNLNTELLVQYLNEEVESNYKTKPLLNIIDEILSLFYEQNHWGYSLPNYLSAIYNTHPNYATYLADKNTLTYENIDEILSIMDDECRVTFSKEYIEELYIRYMARGVIYEEHYVELKERLCGKTVLIIAPGKSVEEESERILEFVRKENVVSVSVGFDAVKYNVDYIFLSNLRRYRDISCGSRGKMIVTSNIPAEGVFLQVDYQSLLNDIEVIKDNSAMMLIQFLINIGVGKIVLAGLDGYSHEMNENYVAQSMALITRNSVLDAMNISMSKMLQQYREQIEIIYLTKVKYVK